MTDLPTISPTFEEQTSHIRNWVDQELVAAIPLAAELLAWYHSVIAGLSPEHLVTVSKKAADLLGEIIQVEDF